MGDNLYALEKLIDAVHELMTSPGRVQERVGAAWMHLFSIRLDDLPEGKLRTLFLAIKDDLIFDQPEGDEPRLTVTLRDMSDDDASEIARRIATLYDELREWLDGLEAP